MGIWNDWHGRIDEAARCRGFRDVERWRSKWKCRDVMLVGVKSIMAMVVYGIVMVLMGIFRPKGVASDGTTSDHLFSTGCSRDDPQICRMSA